MKPEDTEEEVPERIEDLDEEVPPKADIWSKVRNKQLEAVRCGDKSREVTNNQERYSKEPRNARKKDGEVFCHEKRRGRRALTALSVPVVAKEDERNKQEGRID